MVSRELQEAINNLCAILNEPYELVSDVWSDEAKYLDRTYIPEAICHSERTKAAIVDRLDQSLRRNMDHGKIRHWGRAACGIGRFLLLPTISNEVNYAYARDVIVRISRWRYTRNNLWRRFRPTAEFVVEQLWKDIDGFRDEDDNHIWKPPGIK